MMGTKIPAKFCKDCKWHQLVGTRAMCYRPIPNPNYLVSGDKTMGLDTPCSAQRGLIGKVECGEEGRFWETKGK